MVFKAFSCAYSHLEPLSLVDKTGDTVEEIED